MIGFSMLGTCEKQTPSESRFEGKALGQVRIGDELELIQNHSVCGTIVVDTIIQNGHYVSQAQSGQLIQLITWTPIASSLTFSPVLLETPQIRHGTQKIRES